MKVNKWLRRAGRAEAALYVNCVLSFCFAVLTLFECGHYGIMAALSIYGAARASWYADYYTKRAQKWERKHNAV